ncbi:MAG: YHS domain protein [Gammaproteobacteria bacterium]|nr:MAG: YHS domain protein [Gammaproteobacteria bacterium]
MKKKIIIAIILVLIIGLLAFANMNKISSVSWIPWGDINNTNGIAMSGYDPVAYFTLNRATVGDETISYNWKNVEWQFASTEHLALFKETPEKYAPQYGGYCATAISIGLTADVDPRSWHIEDGKLYLFFNGDPKNDYIADIGDGIIQKSESKWNNR